MSALSDRLTDRNIDNIARVLALARRRIAERDACREHDQQESRVSEADSRQEPS